MSREIDCEERKKRPEGYRLEKSRPEDLARLDSDSCLPYFYLLTSWPTTDS
jgi:hypothetical protein